LHLLRKVFSAHLIGFQLCDTMWELKLALKRKDIMSLQKTKPLYTASKQQYTAAGQEVQVTFSGIHV